MNWKLDLYKALDKALIAFQGTTIEKYNKSIWLIQNPELGKEFGIYVKSSWNVPLFSLAIQYSPELYKFRCEGYYGMLVHELEHLLDLVDFNVGAWINKFLDKFRTFPKYEREIDERALYRSPEAPESLSIFREDLNKFIPKTNNNKKSYFLSPAEIETLNPWI